ncbi:hypothetical protein [Corynebacterium sp.]|uniref:helix-turn-helix transcriptional regulator n=1 Tax=Corynebacterium sp. TaxID=1720 RepID=UPI0028AB17ED|nr:hypothetical protein [Corynebacterium sp.]
MSTSPTTTNNHPHPGDWLVSEMLETMGITQYRLAKDIHVAESQISRPRRGPGNGGHVRHRPALGLASDADVQPHQTATPEDGVTNLRGCSLLGTHATTVGYGGTSRSARS